MQVRIAQKMLSIFLTTAFAFSAAAADGPVCEALFSAKKPSHKQSRGDDGKYGTLRSDFKLNKHYEVLVPDETPIKWQCELGTCHLWSWASQLEQENYKATGKKIEIAAEYWAAFAWMDEALKTLHENVAGAQFDLGKEILASRRIIINAGIIPKEAWGAGNAFQIDPRAEAVQEYMQNIIARAKVQLKGVKDHAKRLAIVKVAQDRIRQVFENEVGQFPKTFKYEGAEYTPHSFAEKFFPQLSRPVINMRINDDRNEPTTYGHFDGGIIINTNIDKVLETMKFLMDRGQNVFIAYSHDDAFADDTTGIMSIAAFNVPPGGGPLPRAQRARFDFNEDDGHAVQGVGYNIDPKTGKITQVKIKNSWGEEYGDHGYYHMFADYLRANVQNIYFYANDGVPLPKGTAAKEDLKIVEGRWHLRQQD